MTGGRHLETATPRNEVSLAILQPTSMCNLNCSYCYVPDRKDSTLMSDAVLEAAAAFVYAAAPDNQKEFKFLWHAGEPLAAGIAFYERAFALINAARPSSVSVSHSFQTNGTLVTEEWCSFLSNYDVRFGISIDGPQAIHDSNRFSWSRRGSFDRAMRGLDLLRRSGYNPSAICVLTPDSLERPDEIYDFFTQGSFPSVGFNLEETEGAHSESPFLNLRPSDARRRYVRFMRRIWDRWIADDGRLSIREFDRDLTIIAELQKDPTFVAVPDEVKPFANITVLRDGTIGAFAPELMATESGRYEDFGLGNVLVDRPSDVLSGDAMKKLWADIEEGREACERTCAYFAICGAGFQPNRFAEHGTLTATDTATCRIHLMALFDVVVSGLEAATASETSRNLGRDRT